ncbi:hypothetical protein [Hymenobacter cellulosilyticus]|uniref:Outer membrane protein beta-barrel domain-containing protein n=1 Tax=Hymenobacter cellulosilyticus TaxID=2932248 RepID=A0A8T9Q756_9BACT|nr:hypothetical protein [Hymenobacter cellulosilyticus]UOQ73426.1 hypothetical protein MUN79_05615 [Hymenobacter cellulosilyticus]
MNKFICAAALCCGSALSVRAQTSAGTILLSGAINYNTSTEDRNGVGSFSFNPSSTEDYRYLRLSPSAGFFVADKLVVGLQADFTTSKRTLSQDEYINATGAVMRFTSIDEEKGVTVGPFVRYYQMLGEKLGLYGQLAGGYFYGTYEQRGDYQLRSQQGTSKGGYGRFTPGIVFFPTPKLALELTVGNASYNSGTSKSRYSAGAQEGTERKYSNFQGSFGFQHITVGAAFHLGS